MKNVNIKDNRIFMKNVNTIVFIFFVVVISVFLFKQPQFVKKAMTTSKSEKTMKHSSNLLSSYIYDRNSFDVENGVTSLSIDDIDNDGDTDMVTGIGNKSDGTGWLTWWENNGNTPASFSKHIINHDVLLFELADTDTIDLDSDGDTDIIGALHDSTNNIIWWENDGNNNPSFTRHPITSDLYGAFLIKAADINNDGYIDIVSQTNSSFSSSMDAKWWENDGSENFTEHLLNDPSPWGGLSLDIVDLDNDNDLDITTTVSPNYVVWWENDGSPQADFVKNTITYAASTHFSFPSDLDGDNDIDILISGQDRFSWYENDGSTNPSFTENILSTSSNEPDKIYAGDIDNDNDTDIVTDSGAEINLWLNDGSTHPSFEQVSIEEDFGAYDVLIGNINNNANQEIIAFSLRTTDTVAWWKQETSRPVYRFWSDNYKHHFYTISESEKEYVKNNLSHDWTYEGTAYKAFRYESSCPNDTTPLFRFWSDNYRGHFYTASNSEKEHVINNLSHDWDYEGIAYCVSTSSIAPMEASVYRFWSDRYKGHFYTASTSERDYVINNLAHDWTYEGIAFYVNQ